MTGRAGFLAVRLRIEEQVGPRRRADVGARARRAAWHGGDRRLAAILPQPFVAAEEERAVVDDRPAEVAAELVAGQLRDVLVGASKKVFESQRLSRLNSNTEPWKSLVPERVIAVTMPPVLRPYSAL